VEDRRPVLRDDDRAGRRADVCRTAEEGGFSELVHTPADGETLTFGDLFRKDLPTFTNLYDFLFPLLDFGDTDVAKRAMFYRVLWEVTKQDERSETSDLSTVDLLDVVSRPRGPAVDIQLASGEARELNSLGAAGSGTNRDPKLMVLEEIVNRLNEIFGQDLPKDVRENLHTGCEAPV
jgi:hypothetical protein